MSNQAATLASRERRKLVRLLAEASVQVANLQSLMYGFDQADDLNERAHDDLIDHFVDLHSLTINMVTSMDRWGAFIEGSENDNASGPADRPYGQDDPGRSAA